MLATIIYRFNTAISQADKAYPDFKAGNGVRTPAEIVNHMSKDILSARRHLIDPGMKISDPEKMKWEDEVERFKNLVRDVDQMIASGQHSEDILLLLLQGPFTDVLTHIGQLATLSRLNGKPIPGQSFMKAKVDIND